MAALLRRSHAAWAFLRRGCAPNPTRTPRGDPKSPTRLGLTRGCAPNPTRPFRGDPECPTPRPRGAHCRAPWPARYMRGMKPREGNCDAHRGASPLSGARRLHGAGHPLRLGGLSVTSGGRWERASRSANRRRRAGGRAAAGEDRARARSFTAGSGISHAPAFPRVLGSGTR